MIVSQTEIRYHLRATEWETAEVGVTQKGLSLMSDDYQIRINANKTMSTFWSDEKLWFVGALKVKWLL